MFSFLLGTWIGFAVGFFVCSALSSLKEDTPARARDFRSVRTGLHRFIKRQF